MMRQRDALFPVGGVLSFCIGHTAAASCMCRQLCPPLYMPAHAGSVAGPLMSRMTDLALTCEHLVKTYGKGRTAVHALKDVSLSVSRGEIFGLLGPNGAGKTTLIKCVLGIIYENGGTGSVLGSPFGSLPAKRKLGYLPENHKYPAHLTGAQVLRFFGALSGLEGAELERAVDRSLDATGIRDWRDVKVQKFSKGMMQRLGLAQAMMNDPALIILDEPTDGVDPVGRKEIRDILLRLKAEGVTIFLNSHLLSEVERISDRVAIMDQGAIIKEGRVDALTRAEEMYVIELRDVTEAALSAIGEGLRHRSGNTLEVSAPSSEELNAILDRLRATGAVIDSMTPKRSSLEDLFLELITTRELKQR